MSLDFLYQDFISLSYNARMEKINDFDIWNEVKKHTNNKPDQVLYHSGDIWWCKLGKNVGHEQDGKGTDFERPVLVVKDFNTHVCLVVPLTTKNKENKFHKPVAKIGCVMNYAILSQIRLIDTRRFTNKIGHVVREDLSIIKKAIQKLIE